MKRFFCFLIFTFLFILCLLAPFSSLLFTPAYTQSDWGPDVRLTYRQGYSYHPKAACNGDTVHLVWWKSYAQKKVFYKRSTDAGETWSRKMELGEGKYPVIAIRDVPDYPPCIVWSGDDDSG